MAGPYSDLSLVYTIEPGGNFIVDYQMTAQNDLSLVAGPQRIQQFVTRWLLTPRGSVIMAPWFGNDFYSLRGAAAPYSNAVIVAMVEQAEQDIITWQRSDVALGYLSSDELIDSFIDINVTDISTGAQPGYVGISFTIVTQSQVVIPTTITYANV